VERSRALQTHEGPRPPACTDKQDARSIDDQLRRCRAFAEGRGLTVVAVHQDAAMSGASRARPGLQRLLAEAKRKAFDAVIVDDLSRLSRDLGNTWNLIFGDLGSVGVRVIDATTGMASDAAGRASRSARSRS
jgi:DNA invertase Pin-like site-specific DNA recombinase